MLLKIITEMGLYLGITAVVLLLLNSRRNKNNLLLAGILFSMWYVLLVNYLSIKGATLTFPMLQRSGLGIAFLTGPLLYLYTRHSFQPGSLFRKWDAVIFMPTLLYFIDFSPLWLRSAASNESYAGSNNFYIGLRYCWLPVFYFLQVGLLIKNRSKFFTKAAVEHKPLYLFLVMLAVLYLPAFIPGNMGFLPGAGSSSDIAGVSLAIALDIVSMYLIFRRPVLNNKMEEPAIPQDEPKPAFRQEEPAAIKPTIKPVVLPREPNTQHPTSCKKEMPFPAEKAEELDIKINTHLKNTKAYTQSGYTIYDLSKETGIPVYQISPLLNNYYNNNFNNWINSFRVHYFLELAIQQDSRRLTQEALANQAGFSNRVTFNKAFRKQMGIAPGEYLKRVKEIATFPSSNRIENRA